MDTIQVAATRGSARFKVRYLYGVTDVTSQVVAGTFTIPNLAPGSTGVLKAVVTAKANARRGERRNLFISLTSASDPTARDVVMYGVTAR